MRPSLSCQDPTLLFPQPVRALLNKVTPEELAQFFVIVSDELKTTTDHETFQTILDVIPATYWPRYSEVARIRVETELINDIKAGCYDVRTHECVSGIFGTLAIQLEEYFVLKKQLISVLGSKLRSHDIREQDYVFEHFTASVLTKPLHPIVMLAFREGLAAGDARFYQAMSVMLLLFDEVPEALKALYDNFGIKDAAKDTRTPDEAPF